MAIPKIFLRRGKEESLQRRHPWIFSGAIYSVESDRELVEGEIVDLFSSKGEFLARGHYQVGSIAVRVLSFEQIDRSELVAREDRECIQCAPDTPSDR